MKLLSLDQFLFDYNWTDNMRHKLRVMADRDDLRYLVAYEVSGKLTCAAFTEKPNDWPVGTLGLWSKRQDDPRPETAPAKSKTMQAVDLVLDKGMSVYAAAKQIGIQDSAVHKALKRREGKDICPCCNQVIKGPALAPSAA
jgi:hypothetical protein